MSGSRYAIGIDLGTTHCALSWVDSERSEGERIVQDRLPVPQLVSPGAVESRPLLPSFLYLPHADEFRANDLGLPWQSDPTRIVGELARNQGVMTPIRLVSSAKSWLCHPDIDRQAPILPPGVPDEIPQISPFDATIHYLAHLRNAWNGAHPYEPLDRLEVTVTVPASFDPAARELTAEAAKAIGIKHLVLLEEPQAALYSWVNDSQGEWRRQVQVGDIILVVDVGGGTTDLSLIAVTEHEGALELNRVAVGEHILLGGDNMDLALAYVLRHKLAAGGVELDRWQLQALTHACRQAKETLLADAGLERVPVVVPSRGSKLIGGSIRTELTRDEVRTSLIEGFFPAVESGSRPTTRSRGALTKVGLPYAQDPAITRHLAAFLGRQAGATQDLAGFVDQPKEASFLRPTAVLFNGGVFKAELLQERVMDVLNGWLAAEDAPPARRLEARDLDLAVARGAAFYAHARRHGGVRIRGGTSHTYYVGVESAMPAVPGMEPEIQALCLVPFGLEEGSEPVAPPQEFGLVVGEPVRFRFFGSSVRREDQVGDLLEDWHEDELAELDEIQTTLNAEDRKKGEVVAVRLQAAVTEVGTLELTAIPIDGGDERWNVAFNTRGQRA
ncbi:Hsp70 family protein [Allochromatium vinosum]|uniref:DnaK-related protein n=1 Tax=Allochromatium vinosum (strain ATCC 17899 / DSM 180 / NBRC 103801 / NCIMB 10441 / D) TaxID=572477 RepID=D3RTA0_ALLVD|nr:Hsp70 family protein [Allochromatium vinosum]ADC62409.1 DnaK-related protein [Allochromatium vinosum DSM 180]